MGEVSRMPFNHLGKPSKVKREPLYSVEDIANLLELTKAQVYYRIDELKLEPVHKTIGFSEKRRGGNLYSRESMYKIKEWKV